MDEQHAQKIVQKVIKQLHVSPGNNMQNEISGHDTTDKSPIYSGHSTQNAIPIGVSARHCHLCERDFERLFGMGSQLTKRVNLSQPGQFAANETVTIVGPKGCMEHVRILGPLRKATQVEVSQTDTFKLGVKAPIRLSGETKGSSPVTIVGPEGSIYLQEGLIIAQAHIHMSPDDADYFDVHDGEDVYVRIQNEKRPIRFERVKIRTSPQYHLEMHLDTDEANAAGIQTGDKGRIMKAGSDL